MTAIHADLVGYIFAVEFSLPTLDGTRKHYIFLGIGLGGLLFSAILTTGSEKRIVKPRLSAQLPSYLITSASEEAY